MNQAQQFSSSNHFSEFRETADRICAIAARYGTAVTGYRSPELSLYRHLPLDRQASALHSLKVYLSTMEAAEASGGNLSKDNCFAWAALSALGLVPPSDLISRLRADRAIEIYNLDGQQIWRNLECMEYCSYTLEEVHCIELFDRYEREEEKTAECMKIVGELLSGQTPELYRPNVAPYVLKETCSQDRMTLNVQHELLCTLKSRDGQVVAWLVMSEAKILNVRLQADWPPLSIVPSHPSLQA